MAEANRRRKARAEAKKQAKAEAKQRADQIDADNRQAQIDAAESRARALRQLEEAAARQRQQALDDARMQAAFDAWKPGTMSTLKGVDGGVSVAGTPWGNLKGIDNAASGQPAPDWTVKITDPQVAPMARHLASVVPPLPIPAKEAKLDWKKIYLNDDRLMNAADLVIVGWEMTGVLGESISTPCKILLIGGKSLIAGEDGAYTYLVKKDADYDAALAYLKNPSQAQQFAHLVQDVRLKHPLPANADPAMVRAAQAVTDTRLGDTGAVVWDAMTSKEALGAMMRKAVLEVASDMAPSTEGLLQDEAERKVLFDSVRLERTRARKMLEQGVTTAAQREQLKTVIRQADKLSSDLYKVDKINQLASSAADSKISNAWDEASEAIADRILGPEAKGREY